MNKTQDWAIIGGGFLGMTLALRLIQQGHKVTIYESAFFLFVDEQEKLFSRQDLPTD